MATSYNFATAWESISDATPNARALVQGARSVTWAEFDERSARLAGALTSLGVNAGAKVASYLYNSNEYLEGIFATWKLRGAPVNVNYRYLEDELIYLLDNSDAEVLLFHGVLGTHVSSVMDRVKNVKVFVQVDDGHPLIDGAHAYEDLIANASPMERVERDGEDLYILYTGGTTGMPKGVMWRVDDLYRALVPSVLSLSGISAPEQNEEHGEIALKVAEKGNTATHLPASPLMHGTGFMTSLQSLTAGGSVCTLEQRNFSATELWEAVETAKVTQMAIVGDAFGKPMVAALEEAEAGGKTYDLSSLRMLISSGVMWTAPVKEALMERGEFICLDSLGSSEGAGFANQVSTKGSTAKTARFSIGAFTKVFTEDGREVARGSDEIGILALGGPIPFGYYKDPEKSAATFREYNGERYSVPGDFAKVLEDGTIELLGRGSVVINTGGEKVFPEEVEEAIKLHPAVFDVLVVGVPDDRFGESITAVVALNAGQQATEEEIADAVRGHLAGFKRPRRVILVDRVVRGPNGKADYAWAKETAKSSLA